MKSHNKHFASLWMDQTNAADSQEWAKYQRQPEAEMIIAQEKNLPQVYSKPYRNSLYIQLSFQTYPRWFSSFYDE